LVGIDERDDDRIICQFFNQCRYVLWQTTATILWVEVS
jgi:hypothetical protein